jgi:hypothetical protein
VPVPEPFCHSFRCSIGMSLAPGDFLLRSSFSASTWLLTCKWSFNWHRCVNLACKSCRAKVLYCGSSFFCQSPARVWLSNSFSNDDVALTTKHISSFLAHIAPVVLICMLCQCVSWLCPQYAGMYPLTTLSMAILTCRKPGSTSSGPFCVSSMEH